MKPPRSIAALLALIASSSCHGAVSVKAINSCSAASITDTSIVEVNQAGGKWDIDFRANASGDYFICGGSSDVIRLIHSDAANAVTVSTVGGTPTIDAIEEISGSFGLFNIGTIRVISRVGPSTPTTSIAVSVNNIALLESPDGALNGAVAVRSTGDNAGGNITRINFPQATLRADVRNDNPSGVIGQIDCKNIQGTSADSVDIVAKGSLGILNVGTFDANGNGVGGDAVFVNIGDPALPLASRTMIARDLTFANDFSGHIALKSLRIPVIFGNAREWGILRCGRDFEGVPGATTFCFGKWCSCIMAGSAHDFAAGGKVVA